VEEQAIALRELAMGIGACPKCELAKTRTRAVPGEGNPNADIVFIGEGPGFHEDQQARPFVGAAGKFLDELLASIGLRRSDVFICNVLKCRPPGNRTPAPDEMAACMPWLQRQIATIQPKVICGLGNIAVQTLLVTKTGITKLHGRLTEAQGTPFLPTFHPAYILRNMSELPLFEADVKQALQTAGLLPA
jgi:DNA polymerase